MNRNWIAVLAGAGAIGAAASGVQAADGGVPALLASISASLEAVQTSLGQVAASLSSVTGAQQTQQATLSQVASVLQSQSATLNQISTAVTAGSSNTTPLTTSAALVQKGLAPICMVVNVGTSTTNVGVDLVDESGAVRAPSLMTLAPNGADGIGMFNEASSSVLYCRFRSSAAKETLRAGMQVNQPLASGGTGPPLLYTEAK